MFKRLAKRDFLRAAAFLWIMPLRAALSTAPTKLTNNSSLVIFDKLHEKWRIQLKNGDKKYFVGSYDSENEAKKAS